MLYSYVSEMYAGKIQIENLILKRKYTHVLVLRPSGVHVKICRT